MESWIQITSLMVSIVSAFIIPSVIFFYKKLKAIETNFQFIMLRIEKLQLDSDKADAELNKNWLHFYHNEIMRFMERVHVKPELIPSQEHYRSVFDNYKRYKELGGNGYVDILIDQIEDLYKQHYNKQSWPPRKIK